MRGPETRQSLLLRLRDTSQHDACWEFTEIYSGVSARSASLGRSTRASRLPGKVGDTVLVTGKLHIDEDFGHGYKYQVILQTRRSPPSERVSTESETIKQMGIQNDNPIGLEDRIRAAVFFFIFFGVLLAIGGWLTYTFGLADARSPLQMVGLSLGLLNLASAAVPLGFALAIVRQILRQRKHAN